MIIIRLIGLIIMISGAFALNFYVGFIVLGLIILFW